MGNGVSVVSEETLRPVVPLAAPLPLSYADSSSAPSYIRVIVLYAVPGAEFEAAVGRLRAGLQRALDGAPELGGAVVRRPDGAEVVAADEAGRSAGVGFTVQAAPYTSMADLALRDYALEALPDPLTQPVGMVAAVDPLVAVHVTKLGEDGLALGLSVHHYLADGGGLAALAAVWSAYSRGEDGGALPLHRDRAVLQARATADLPSSAVLAYSEFGAPDPAVPRYHREPPPGGGSFVALGMDARLRSRVWRLPKDALAALRARAAADAPPGAAPLSSNDVLSAWVWRCVSAARRLPPDTVTKLATACDARARMTPPLPPGYLGNANFAFMVESSAGDLAGRPLAATAAAIRTRLAAVDESFVRAAMHWIGTLPHKCDVPVAFRCSYGPDVGITNWSRFPIYGANFGFGTPVRVRTPASLHEGHVTILPGDFAPDTTAAELVFNLAVDDMERLATVPDFVALLPAAAAALAAEFRRGGDTGDGVGGGGGGGMGGGVGVGGGSVAVASGDASAT